MNDVAVVEASDLDESNEEGGEIPAAPLRWPDGRMDILPHSCSSQSVGSYEILRGHPDLHLGLNNLLPGILSGSASADLARLGTDVFYSRVSDGNEEILHYLRGVLGPVAQYWLDRIVSYTMPPSLPWAALILCAHYSLLPEVNPGESQRYEVNLFLEKPARDMAGLVIDFDQSLSKTDMIALVRMLEDDGCTWPRHVSMGDPKAVAAWEKRIDEWSG
jgi:hypothetical protein